MKKVSLLFLPVFFIAGCFLKKKESQSQKNDIIFKEIIIDSIQFSDDKKPDSNEEPVFIVVENPPEFSGSEEARIKFLAENIVYPPNAREQGIQGTVFVSFIIEPDGSISNIKILRGVTTELDNEVIRVVKLMPKWIPGKQRGKAVRVQYNMPLKFSLANDEDEEK